MCICTSVFFSLSLFFLLACLLLLFISFSSSSSAHPAGPDLLCFLEDDDLRQRSEFHMILPKSVYLILSQIEKRLEEIKIWFCR